MIACGICTCQFSYLWGREVCSRKKITKQRISKCSYLSASLLPSQCLFFPDWTLKIPFPTPQQRLLVLSSRISLPLKEIQWNGLLVLCSCVKQKEDIFPLLHPAYIHGYPLFVYCLSPSLFSLPIHLSITVCLPTYLNTYLEKEGER